MEDNFTKMAAMGRRFQMGDLYDYHTDNILTNCRLWWDSSKFANATDVTTGFKINLIRPDSNFSNKWQHMGLDDHLQASIVTGLINKFSGASNYLNDPSSPSQVTQTLVCRTKSRKERLDVQTLLQQMSPLRLPDSIDAEMKLPKATHVVVGIVYGAEAYCVLSQDLGISHEADEEAREEAEENLGKLATKLENALGDIDFDAQLPDFKEQFTKEEKAQLTRLKCRFYSDLQSLAVRECNVIEVYAHCLKLIRQIKEDVENKSKAIPITVLLCPVKFILKLSDERLRRSFGFRDVDSEVTARMCRNWLQLEEIRNKAEAIRASSSAKKINRASLKSFLDVLNEYKHLLRESLKNGVTRSRQSDDGDDDEVERVNSIAESHGLFKPIRLERWLRFKVSESEVVGKISGINGILFLSGKQQLEKKLADSFEKKYALVLTIPSSDGKANEILEEMKYYCENYSKLVAVEDDTDDEDDQIDEERLPWHMGPRRTKQVMDKIRQFANHVEKNKHLENQVQFYITSGEPGQDGCRYSVYEADNLLKDNLDQLPVPPTDLKIRLAPAKPNKKTTPSIIVSWDYEDLGYPCHFSVEFRPMNSSDPWIQQKTAKSGENQMILNYSSGGPELEIRVAADTCIGRSEFSDVIDTETALGVIHLSDSDLSDDLDWMTGNLCISDSRQGASASAEPSQRAKKLLLQPPTGLEVDLVTKSTCELSWRAPFHAGSLSYRVCFWRDGQTPSSAREVDVRETGCRLQELQPNTTYFVSVVAVDGQDESGQSASVRFTTEVNEMRFAETIVKKCKKIVNRNGMDVFAVPLTKLSGPAATADRFAFGRADALHKGKMQHRTILVMGATGSGKTTLINGMINFIFDVQWEDTFRFQLIEEQTAGRSQVDSQTSRITAYEINHKEGFRVPYSLTIVDTPGYGDTKGLERDQEITEMVRKFFEERGGIQELDVVGFVAQASLPRLTPTQIYIFDSVLSIFGNDIKENINFLLTFADSQVPPILSAITEADLPCPTDDNTGRPLHHKFNNSGFFCSSRESGIGPNTTYTVDKFNRFFWQMGMNNFQLFFIGLGKMKTKSLSLTKQVLDERKRLEATVDGLQPLIKIGLSKMEEMRKTKQMISNCQAQIDANENVELVVEVTVPKKVDIRAGLYLTNCNKCYVTCHYPCAIPNDDDKVGCAAMDRSMPEETRSCRICPEKCIWNMHANQPYKWEYVSEQQATSSNAIKQKYEAELKRKLTAHELIQILQKDLDDNEKAVLERVNTVSRCIQRLDEIALRPNPFSTPQYIDLIIDAEQQEKRLGFKERIESLKKLRQMADITSKIKNKESLFSEDGKDGGENLAADDDEGDGLLSPIAEDPEVGATSGNMIGWRDED